MMAADKRSGSPRVLHVDDSRLDLELIERHVLRTFGGAEIRRAGSVAEADAALAEGLPDLVLCDFYLPDGTGADVLHTLRAIAPHLPFIAVTGTLGEELAVELITAGATDYVLKSNLVRLIPAIERALSEEARRVQAERGERNLRCLTERIRELQELTLTSTLTFEQHLEAALYAGCRWFGADFGMIGEVRDGTYVVRLRHGASNPPAVSGLPIADSCIAELLDYGDSLAVPSTRVLVQRRHPALGHVELPVYLAAPMEIHRTADRVLEFFGTAPDHAAFMEADFASLQLLARWVQSVLERESFQQQLVQAQKMEAVGTLAGGVAHDFNNLIAAIRASAELLILDLPDVGKESQEAQAILGVAERAQVLTRQLLTFSRHEAAQPQSVDLGRLAERSAEMLRRMLPAGVHIEVAVPDQPVGVFADPGQLEQVLMNLCVNARDAMPDGGTICVRVEHRRPSRPQPTDEPSTLASDRVRISVSDTGIGMDAATRARIFDPFFTTKEVGKGTGLGLAVVWGIVNQHGGEIDVTSEPGRGTTIRITLPVSELPDDASGARPERSKEAPSRIDGCGTILLVDDDDAVRRVAGRVLTRMGYEVVECPDAGAALAAVMGGGAAIALALLDVMLPDMDGVELSARLREHLPALPVMFYSGYSPEDPQLAHVRNLGAVMLKKPFTIDQLAEAVGRAVAGSAPRVS